MVTSLRVLLENCHGIHSLDHTFDFTEGNVAVVYASNGSMKTSFANTFRTYSEGDKVSNPLFPQYEPSHSFEADGNPLDIAHIKVIGMLDTGYESQSIPPLLVSESLRDEYNSINAGVVEQKEILLTAIKSKTKIGGAYDEVSSEIESSFGQGSVVVNLREAHSRLAGFSTDLPDTLKYRQIFNPDVLKLLGNTEVLEGIKDYIELHSEIENNSPFLRNGFGLYQITELRKSLDANSYFEANHELFFKDPHVAENNRPITSLADLDNLIAEQKTLFASDARLVTQLDKIAPKFSTKGHRDFRTVIQDYIEVLPKFEDLDALRTEIMLFAISQCKDELERFIEVDDKARERLTEIEREAAAQRTEWHEVVEEYKRRFRPPFDVDVEDLELGVLGQDGAFLTYSFIREGTCESADVDRSELMNILSQGERRILYLLDIIFDVRARQREGIPTLFVIDDIADSFDYANKYAIIEYLYEISQDPNFRLIVLSHNFDFYRVVCNRFNIEGNRSLLSTRTNGAITLSGFEAPEDFFRDWRDQIHLQPRIGLASLGFVRTLAVHCGKSAANRNLTRFLHMKPDTHNLTYQNLYDNYRDVLTLWPAAAFPSPGDSVFDAIVRECDAIRDEVHAPAPLEDKIVLAIGIRLKAEEFLIANIPNAARVTEIQGTHTPQTRALFNEYSSSAVANDDNCKIIKSVLMMTGENIHLNSFMFEPILDMSIDSLRNLYGEVRDNLH